MCRRGRMAEGLLLVGLLAASSALRLPCEVGYQLKIHIVACVYAQLSRKRMSCAVVGKCSSRLRCFLVGGRRSKIMLGWPVHDVTC